VPNFIKIDPYSFELYRFKVYAFSETDIVYMSLCTEPHSDQSLTSTLTSLRSEELECRVYGKWLPILYDIIERW